MESNLAAALGYPIGLISIILLCTEKKNKFVIFHALQSVLLNVAMGLLLAAFGIVMAIVFLVLGEGGTASGSAGSSIVWTASVLMWSLFPLLFLAAWIIAAVKAYGGTEFKLPVIGKIASNLVTRWSA